MIVEHPKLILPKEFHGALIGYDTKNDKAVYSVEGILETLMINEEWDLEMATDYFYRNIECAYMGERTPMYVYTEGIEEWLEES